MADHEYDNPNRGAKNVGVMPRRPTRYRLIKKAGTVNILEVTGRMAPSEANDDLCKRIDSMIAAGEVNFLLDLSGVSYISSTGVGSLLQCYQHIEQANGQLKLLKPSQSVSHIIKISRLESVFRMYDDEEKALKSFEEQPPAAVVEDTSATDSKEKKTRVRRVKPEA